MNEIRIDGVVVNPGDPILRIGNNKEPNGIYKVKKISAKKLVLQVYPEASLMKTYWEGEFRGYSVCLFDEICECTEPFKTRKEAWVDAMKFINKNKQE